MVEPEKKRKATLFFWFLIILYIIYGTGSIETTVRKRFTPPVSLSRDTSDISFDAPYFTFCNNEDEYPKVQCAYGLKKESLQRFCDMNDNTYFQYYDGDETSPRLCTSVKIIEDITSSLPSISLYISRTVDGKCTYYVSDYKLDEKNIQEAPASTYDIGIFQSSGRYEMEITKQIYHHLKASLGGLGVSKQQIVTYNVNTLYTSDTFDGELFEEGIFSHSPTSSPTVSPISVPIPDSFSATTSNSDNSSSTEAMLVVLFSNSLGMDKLEEVDPVDVLNLIGSIAGVLPYILLIFSFAFAKSIYRNMKKMEDEHHIRMNEVSRTNQTSILE